MKTDHYATIIQKKWISYKTRTRIKFYSKLPYDLWNYVLEKIAIKNEQDKIFQKKLLTKLLLYTWSFPRKNIKKKLFLVKFVSQNSLYIDIKSLKQSLLLSNRLLNYYTCFSKVSLYVNSCIEDMLFHNIKIYK